MGSQYQPIQRNEECRFSFPSKLVKIIRLFTINAVIFKIERCLAWNRHRKTICVNNASLMAANISSKECLLDRSPAEQNNLYLLQTTSTGAISPRACQDLCYIWRAATLLFGLDFSSGRRLERKKVLKNHKNSVCR